MKNHSVGKVLLIEIAVIFFVFLFDAFSMGGFSFYAYFIDIPSMLSLVLFVVPAFLVTGMARDFVNAFSIGKKPYSIAQMKRSLEAVKLLQKFVLCGIGFSTLIAFVALLHSMDDMSSIGPGMAVMSLSVFYGIIAEFLLAPLSAHVQNHITAAMDIPEKMEFANARIILDDDDEED